MKIFISVAMAVGYFVWLYFARIAAKEEAARGPAPTVADLKERPEMIRIAQEIRERLLKPEVVQIIKEDGYRHDLVIDETGAILCVKQWVETVDKDGRKTKEYQLVRTMNIFIFNDEGHRRLYGKKMLKALYGLVVKEIEDNCKFIHGHGIFGYPKATINVYFDQFQYESNMRRW